MAAGVSVAESDAQTAVMAGSFGAGPNYRTLQVCPCERLRFNTLPVSSKSAQRAITRWAATPAAEVKSAAVPGSGRVLFAYSLSADGALGWVWSNPEQARQVEVWLLGSLNTVGNGNKGRNRADGQVLPDGDWSNVTTVVKQYDIVADAPHDRSNWLAVANASLAVHMFGYNGLDLTAPDSVYVDPRTGARTLYFRTDVLPILRWRAWFTSPERMAELDAKYRPIIEAAYDRPVTMEPKTQVQETKTWTEPDSRSAAPRNSESEPAFTATSVRTPDGQDEPGTSTESRKANLSERSEQAQKLTRDSRKDSDRSDDRRRPHRAERGAR
ncbi:PE-PPE domain-containing protein [Mycobacterium sp. SMC-4]|uniref:PE-PPE domain-containing protein n=1 Tax=Mycobacterium sp. SMC-4 TaxID=2857059 RepID=UPI0021B24EFC|nr:PE-PPE domain-containing protein [Mycobacterium sp. SMC-4]UXA19496.1 PE-PPE domain-containing protein [Mycobacterium sp. SMC-4]